ncbi:MAG: MgtC/SapB family protein [Chloroflexota bacterium]|nr:MAG: MgtC/SapB family protein [Chloroflexota bacterium]
MPPSRGPAQARSRSFCMGVEWYGRPRHGPVRRYHSGVAGYDLGHAARGRPMIDVSLQLDLALRLIVAAGLGAVVGAEREIHNHPAGIRTHMLVALGSGLFTVLSIFGFGLEGNADAAPVDPSRIAAQIVSGIGFLGAGAILKDGVIIRGLTTAASLWATAAVGMAAGAGEHILALVAAVIILVSLWPINALAERLHGVNRLEVELRLTMNRVDELGLVSAALAAGKIEILTIQTQRAGKGAYRADLVIRGRSTAVIASALEAIEAIPGVDIISTSQAD